MWEAAPKALRSHASSREFSWRVCAKNNGLSKSGCKYSRLRCGLSSEFRIGYRTTCMAGPPPACGWDEHYKSTGKSSDKGMGLHPLQPASYVLRGFDPVETNL